MYIGCEEGGVPAGQATKYLLFYLAAAVMMHARNPKQHERKKKADGRHRPRR